MGKFMAIGRHGPVDPAHGRKVAEQAVEWIPARIADGSIDYLYSMEGGGRLVIAEAESAEALRALLDAAPDVPRDWQITELYDGQQVLLDYLSSTA
jgi:hypothetical protein